MAKSPSSDDLRKNLKSLRRADEVISPVDPRGLARGRWCSIVWPPSLTCGLLEPRRGYRFRPENLVLGSLLRPHMAQKILDLGAGSGSLLLIAEAIVKPKYALGIERQAESVERLRRTLSAHRLEHVHVLEGDLREEKVLESAKEMLGEAADLIVANPPFFPPGWGRESAEKSTQLSTHAHHGGVYEFLKTADALLTPKGTLMLVFDAARLASLLAAAGAFDFGMERLSWIPDQRPEHTHEPFRVWVTLRRQTSDKSMGYIERVST